MVLCIFGVFGIHFGVLALFSYSIHASLSLIRGRMSPRERYSNTLEVGKEKRKENIQICWCRASTKGSRSNKLPLSVEATFTSSPMKMSLSLDHRRVLQIMKRSTYYRLVRRSNFKDSRFGVRQDRPPFHGSWSVLWTVEGFIDNTTTYERFY